MQIREAVLPQDAAACARIYAEHVLGGVATFEEVPPSADEMRRRMEAVQQRHVWLVATEPTEPTEPQESREQADAGERVVGFAYASDFKARSAYRFTVETTIYLEAAATGRGIGRALYAELLDRVTVMGFRQALAVIAVPHPASVALHESMGYRLVGTLPDVGWKHGAWRSIAHYQRELGAGAARAPE